MPAAKSPRVAAGCGSTSQRVAAAPGSAGGLTQKQPHDPAVAGPERQPPAGSEVEGAGMAADLGEHGGKPGAAKPLLEHPQSLLRPAGDDDDQAVGGKAEPVETGTVRQPALADRGFLHHPQHRPPVAGREAGEHRGGEAGGGCAVAGGFRPHFVERIAAKTAAEQAIERRNAEGKPHPAPATSRIIARRRTGRRFLKGATGRGHFTDRRFAETGRPALDLGDPPAQPGISLPCHESAGAHGFSGLSL